MCMDNNPCTFVCLIPIALYKFDFYTPVHNSMLKFELDFSRVYSDQTI